MENFALKWFLKRLPLALFLVIIWSIARMSSVNFSIGTPLGIVLTFICFGVIFLEFYKSGDISLNSFGWDLGLSIPATVICATTITLLIQRGFGELFLTDILVAAVILFDAWFSPFNSFRIALRNLMVGNVDAGHVDAGYVHP